MYLINILVKITYSQHVTYL